MSTYLCIRCLEELEIIDTEKGKRGVCHNNNCSGYMRVQTLPGEPEDEDDQIEE